MLPEVVIGRLNKRLELQEPTETQGPNGEPQIEWTTVATRWGSLEPLSGREGLMAKQAGSTTTHRIRLWHCAGLDEKWQIKWGERIFRIENVRNVEELNWSMELMAVERTT